MNILQNPNLAYRQEGFKKLIALVLAMAFVLLPVDAMAVTATKTTTSSCAKIADAYKRRDCYANEAAAAKKAADDKAAQAKVVKQQISNIDGQISEVSQEITSTAGQITETEASIAELEANIKVEEDNLAKQKDKMHQVITSWYMEGDNGGLFEAMLGSNSLSEVTTKEQYYESIRQEISGIMDQVNKTKNELKTQKDSQSKQLVVLNGLKDGQKSQQTNLQSQQDMKNRLLTDTNNAIVALNAQEKDALQKEKDAKGEIQLIEQAAQGGSKWVRAGSSAFGFMWPVPGASMGCGFGFSDCYFAGVFHTGIDLKRYSGATIVASKAGEVIAARDGMGNTYPSSKSYGNYVQIKHEGGVTTLYGHMLSGSLAVSVGDHVEQGQRIGSMGNTGFSTGPHTHFEMRDPYGVAVNPTPSLP